MLKRATLEAVEQANHVIGELREGQAEGDLLSNSEFATGVFLHADPELQIKGRYNSPKGWVLSFDASLKECNAGWVGLHFSLQNLDFEGAGVVGFATRFAGSENQILRACIRSGRDGDFQDCFFDKHLLIRPEEADHVDGLLVCHRDDLPIKAEWRELVLFLPTKSFRITFMDLRVFIA